MSNRRAHMVPPTAGGEMGISARPMGAYQIKGDLVTSVTAVDVSRIVVMGQVVVIVAMLVLRSVLRRRKR